MGLQVKGPWTLGRNGQLSGLFVSPWTGRAGLESTVETPRGHTATRLVTGDTGSFVVFDELVPLPAGRSDQLWALDGTRPVSLGVLGDGATDVAITLPRGTSNIAISEEPHQGRTHTDGDRRLRSPCPLRSQSPGPRRPATFSAASELARRRHPRGPRRLAPRVAGR